jgi:small subunit ribosomal protein S13
MPRIAGVNIPVEKRTETALTYIYGIGLSRAREILRQAGIDPNKRAKDLSTQEINRLKDVVEKKYKVEGELKREIMLEIKRLKDIGSYRGSRHIRRLPARGQRTRTNARTVRGRPKKTVGSGRKPAAEKT